MPAWARHPPPHGGQRTRASARHPPHLGGRGQGWGQRTRATYFSLGLRGDFGFSSSAARIWFSCEGLAAPSSSASSRAAAFTAGFGVALGLASTLGSAFASVFGAGLPAPGSGTSL